MLPGKEESVSETTTTRDIGRTVIAVDLVKSVFEVAVSTRPGQVRLRRRLTRSALLKFFALGRGATRFPARRDAPESSWNLGHESRLVAGEGSALLELRSELAEVQPGQRSFGTRVAPITGASSRSPASCSSHSRAS